MNAPVHRPTRMHVALAYLSIGHLPPLRSLIRRNDAQVVLASVTGTLLVGSVACVAFALAASV